jgi:YaiO family outer membrane protein
VFLTEYREQNLIFFRKNELFLFRRRIQFRSCFSQVATSVFVLSKFQKGWEADLGVRYIKAENAEIKTVVLGVGKYIGSYWINFRSFIQNNNEYDPSFTLTTRYYFDTKYDYLSMIAGYGTSPDDRVTIGQLSKE